MKPLLVLSTWYWFTSHLAGEGVGEGIGCVFGGTDIGTTLTICWPHTGITMKTDGHVYRAISASYILRLYTYDILW